MKNKIIEKLLVVSIIMLFFTAAISVAENTKKTSSGDGNPDFSMTIEDAETVGGYKNQGIYVNGSWSQDVKKIYIKILFDPNEIEYSSVSLAESVIPSGVNSWAKNVVYNETEGSVSLKAWKGPFGKNLKAGSGNLLILNFNIPESVQPGPPFETFLNFTDGKYKTAYYLNNSWNYPEIPVLNNGTLTITPNSIPKTPSDPSGPLEGLVGEEYMFSTDAIDPDGGQIQYGWDWGDGTPIEWTDFNDSGATIFIKHKWTELGRFFYRVKCRDMYGLESGWSNFSDITIMENVPPSKPSTPSGPTEGKLNELYNFTTSATDPGDEIQYGWNWTGGDAVDEWTNFYPSGETVKVSHSWGSLGTYLITVKAKDNQGLESDWSDPLEITITNSPPDTPSKPSGPTSGKIDIEYTYNTTEVVDPEGDPVFYNFSFGDGTYSGWISTPEATHSWSTQGTYDVKVKAKDDKEATSNWSEPLQVKINKPLPILSIESITAKRNRIIAVIKNIGDADANNVEWNITITGGLKLFVNESSGTIDSLAANASEKVVLKGKLVRGIGVGLGILKGMPLITVKVSASNADTMEDSANAKIIFKIVKIV